MPEIGTSTPPLVTLMFHIEAYPDEPPIAKGAKMISCEGFAHPERSPSTTAVPPPMRSRILMLALPVASTVKCQLIRLVVVEPDTDPEIVTGSVVSTSGDTTLSVEVLFSGVGNTTSEYQMRSVETACIKYPSVAGVTVSWP